MGSHINADGQFQSDKYPTCPAGKVPLSVKDETAQDLLWEYAQRRRKVDAEFADDLEQALRNQGYTRRGTTFVHVGGGAALITAPLLEGGFVQVRTPPGVELDVLEKFTSDLQKMASNKQIGVMVPPTWTISMFDSDPRDS